MEMDPLAVVLPQFALDEALAENDARHESEDALAERGDEAAEHSKDDEPADAAQ